MYRKHNPKLINRRNCQKFRLDRVKPRKFAKTDPKVIILTICSLLFVILVLCITLTSQNDEYDDPMTPEEIKEVLSSDELADEMDDIMSKELQKLQDFMDKELQKDN